jgi:hypothetical protein
MEKSTHIIIKPKKSARMNCPITQPNKIRTVKTTEERIIDFILFFAI